MAQALLTRGDLTKLLGGQTHLTAQYKLRAIHLWWNDSIYLDLSCLQVSIWPACPHLRLKKVLDGVIRTEGALFVTVLIIY